MAAITPVALVQLRRNDCGAACLAMILSTFGYEVSVRTCARRMRSQPCDRRSVLALVVAASDFGLACRAFRANAKALRSLSSPAILHWEGTHFVVLQAWAHDGRAIVLDPYLGRRKLTFAELASAYAGVFVKAESSNVTYPPRSNVRLARARRIHYCLWTFPILTLRRVRWRLRRLRRVRRISSIEQRDMCLPR